MLAGMAFGGVAINQLSAQSKMPGAYVVFDVTSIDKPDLFKTLLPLGEQAAKAHDGTFIVRTENIVALDGVPPKRFVIVAFDSMSKAQAYHNSAELKEVDDIRARSTTSRSFIVDGAIK